MFYKVPSGLGIYFITSSLWAIGERLLLPKVTHATPAPASVDGEAADQKGFGPRGGKGSPNGDGQGSRGGKDDADDNGAKAKPPGRFAQFLDRVLDEARKDPTYRKVVDDRDDKGNDKDRDKDRPRPKPRRR
jgi:YidC/Oxa1 family membrane protein insertase